MKDDLQGSAIEQGDNERWDEWLLDFNAKLTDEDPKLKQEALEELRKRISAVITGWEHALDDRHLLKFLRFKKFDANGAYGMLRLIQKARLADPLRYLPAGKGPLDYAHVYNLRCVEILPHRNPRDGSAIVVLRLGDWTPQTGVDIKMAHCAGSFLADYVLDDERIQRHGVTLILNCTGVTTSALLHFFPLTCIPSTVTTVQDGYPVRFSGVHLVNQPFIYKVVYKIAWPFINKENLAIIHFHGKNVAGLHEYVPAEILPRDLLGSKEPDYTWLPELVYKRHDDYVARSMMPNSP